MIQIKKSKMTREQLEQTPEYMSLTRKQRFFISTLVQTVIDLGLPDPAFACSSAFGNTGELARTMSYQVLRKPKVQAVLRVYENYGKTPKQVHDEEIQSTRQQYLAELKSEMDASTGAKRERLVALYGQLIFGKTPKHPVKRKSSKKKGKSNGNR